MDIYEHKKLIFTSHTKYYFYFRMLICKYVLEHDAVPLNPFNIWGYFLYELTDRALVRRGNINIIRAVDELWVFGPVSDGILAEIRFAMELNKPIKFFTVGSKYEHIKQLDLNSVAFEDDALAGTNENKLREEIKVYLASFNELV